VGASNKPYSVGFSLMKNLIGSGYNGTVYPINPNRKNVMGIHCYKSVLELPEKADLAIIATPAKTVPAIAKECVKAKIKALIVVSSGFSEIGKEGAKLEKELKAAIAKSDSRLLGPNCLGYIRTDKKINASFAIRNALPGKMALISQSGALCSSILDWAQKQKVGFKYFVSVGGMLDITFADLIDFINTDSEVESIAIYMESIKDTRKFMSAARNFSKNKPIIVAKSGRFAESAKAAISHTGAMAGSDEVFEAAFERAGIVRVENIQDLLGTSEALAKEPLPKGNRIAIITNAGGPGVMAVDAIVKNNCELAKLSKKTMSALEKEMPSHWSRNNPIDLLGDAKPETYEKAIGIILREDNVDGIIVILSPQAISKPNDVAKTVAEKIQGTKKTVLACWMGESFVEQGREILRKKDVPVYRTPEEAVRVFSYMNAYRENIRNLYETPCEISTGYEPRTGKSKKIIKSYLYKKNFVLTEIDSKKILEDYGMPVNTTLFARSPKDAIAKAKKIGFPVALKIVSSDITHKTDAKAVALNIASEKQLRKAYAQIMLNAKKANPKARIQGVSVQEMVDAGNLELIIGSKFDDTFGTVIMFGSGGVLTELMQDKSLELPPITQTLARRMIDSTKASRLLKGYRKKFRANIPELEKILINFSQLVVDFPEIREIDVNPLIVAQGKYCAVDARIILQEKPVGRMRQLAISPYPKELSKKFKVGKESFLFRAIRPEDEPKMKALFDTFSEKTVKNRFFHAIREMTHEMLIRYCFNDYDREIAIVVEMPRKKGKPLIGVGRMMKDIGKNSAEIALVVTDKFQHQGIGEKLLKYLEKIAKQKGIVKLWGVTSTESTGMLRITKDLGYSTARVPGENEIRIEKKIS
ncbi:MAG: bifunctional acetate--CoA ligase family protein/GNAT family N-acetyltransferase, partial [Candidatus Diapherotrites archaeon]|nr:bifunctional acetate--CoA ligase family protein/GNAT family N-acetyltransferase [Candidatus Diapherotrites archaeon]